MPIGLEEAHVGCVDLLERKTLHFEGARGERVVEGAPGDVPDDLVDLVDEKRATLLEVRDLPSFPAIRRFRGGSRASCISRESLHSPRAI